MKLRNIITKEICDAEMREDGIYIKANWSDEEKWFCYDLKTLARGWEYYIEPKEPYIKDEKIRKAVKAWAEANGIERVWHEYSSCWLRGNGLRIEMENEITELEQNNYAIAELCGEEE